MVFSERLKELREEKKLNQRELADALEAEPSKYNKWESGKNRPDFETVYKIAKFFNTTSDYLLGLSDLKHIKIVEEDDLGEFLKIIFKISKSKAVKSIDLHENFHEFQHKLDFNLALFKEGKIDEEMLDLWCDAKIKESKGKSVSEIVNRSTAAEIERKKIDDIVQNIKHG